MQHSEGRQVYRYWEGMTVPGRSSHGLVGSSGLLCGNMAQLIQLLEGLNVTSGETVATGGKRVMNTLAWAIHLLCSYVHRSICPAINTTGVNS